MVTKKDALEIEFREHMRDGDGTVKIQNLVGKDELLGKGRLFARLILEPGCSIGYHVHEGDSEIFNVIKGEGVYSDGGVEKRVAEGDVMVCPEGTGHSIRNDGESTLVLTALIVYA